MRSTVGAWQAAGKRVFFHDPNCLSAGTPGKPDAACAAADPPTWAADGSDYWTYGIHFSENGYAKMSAAWAKALHAHWQ